MDFRIRTPGVYTNHSQARSVGGVDTQPPRVLMIGTGTAAATVSTLVLQEIIRDGQADGFFGPGPEIARMCQAFLSHNLDVKLYAIRVSATVGALDATAMVRFSVALPTSKEIPNADVLYLRIAGQLLPVRLSQGWSAVDAASATATAVNLPRNMRLPVTAELHDSMCGVLLREKTLGILGGGYPLEVLNGRHGNELPAGFETLAFLPSGLTGGYGGPDICEDCWAVLEGVPFDYVVAAPATDSVIELMEQELARRADGMDFDRFTLVFVPSVVRNDADDELWTPPAMGWPWECPGLGCGP